MTVKIRKGLFQDIRRCRELLCCPGTTTHRGEGPSEKYLRLFRKERQLFLVAEMDGVVIGCIFGERVVGNGMLLQTTAVDKGVRGLGVGKSLLEAAEKECSRMKCPYILLYGFFENPAVPKMLKSYHSNGFSYREYVKILGDKV